MATHPELQQAMNAIRRQRFDEAAMLLSRLLASQPNNLPARWMLIQTLENQHKVDSALEQLQVLLALSLSLAL